MGARQSRRSVDITTTPKKGGEVDNVGEGEGKVENIGDLEDKVTTNGAIHTELEYAVSSAFVIFLKHKFTNSISNFYNYIH